MEEGNFEIQYTYLFMDGRRFVSSQEELIKLTGTREHLTRAIPTDGHRRVLVAAGRGHFSVGDALDLEAKLRRDADGREEN